MKTRNLMAVLLAAVTVLSPRPAAAQKLLADGIRDLGSQIGESVSQGAKKRVAVVPFRDLRRDPSDFGQYLAEELTTSLFSVKGLVIVERSQLDKVLHELKLGQSGAIDPESARQIGKIAGADALVTGTITDLASAVAVNCRLIDTQTGTVFAAAGTKIVKDDDVRAIMGTGGGGAAFGATGAKGVPSTVKSGEATTAAEGKSTAGAAASTANSSRIVGHMDEVRFEVVSARKRGAVASVVCLLTSEAEDLVRIRTGLYFKPSFVDDTGFQADQATIRLTSGKEVQVLELDPQTPVKLSIDEIAVSPEAKMLNIRMSWLLSKVTASMKNQVGYIPERTVEVRLRGIPLQ